MPLVEYTGYRWQPTGSAAELGGDIASLVFDFWLEGQSAGDMTTLTSRAGSGSAVLTAETNAPVIAVSQVNGLPALQLRAASSQSAILGANIPVTGAFTMLVVAKLIPQGDPVDFGVFFGNSSGGLSTILAASNTAPTSGDPDEYKFYIAGDGGAGDSVVSGAITENAYKCYIFGRTAADAYFFRVNGTEVTADAEVGCALDIERLGVFDTGSGDAGWGNYDIARAVLWDAEKDSSARAALASWAISKYALT